MGQAGLTLDHDVPRVGFLPLLHVSLREGTERERGVRGERDGWVLELVGCGREGNSRRATNRRSVSAHTSTPYISSSLVCITPNRTAYAKQQPPLRPRATEEMVVDIVFDWYRGVWADVSAGGAFSRPMMTVRFLKPGSSSKSGCRLPRRPFFRARRRRRPSSPDASPILRDVSQLSWINADPSDADFRGLPLRHRGGSHQPARRPMLRAGVGAVADRRHPPGGDPSEAGKAIPRRLGRR